MIQAQPLYVLPEVHTDVLFKICSDIVLRQSDNLGEACFCYLLSVVPLDIVGDDIQIFRIRPLAAVTASVERGDQGNKYPLNDILRHQPADLTSVYSITPSRLA